MGSDTVRQWEEAYACGEMDDLKASIVPFLRSNRAKLRQFIQDFQKVGGPKPLAQLVKIFIIQHNMPFDMTQYMCKQSTTIRMELAENLSAAERQACVADWIRRKAEAHRSSSMFQQVFCFEKMKDELLPFLEAELNLHASRA